MQREYHIMPPRLSSSLLTAVLFAVVVGPGDGFTVGPPPLPTVCKTMYPQHHDYKPQSVESPYGVSVDRSEIIAGQSATVSLATFDPATKFIGFYLQARDENDNAIGQFTPNEDTKVHNCLGKRANAAHHASGLVKKENITIVWTSPRNFQGEIVFTATMMRDFVTYWVFLQSDPLVVKMSESQLTRTSPAPPPLARPSRPPRQSLNETLINLFDHIGSIFTVRIANRTANTSNDGSGGRCNTNRVFNLWFCNLFRDPNAIGR